MAKKTKPAVLVLLDVNPQIKQLEERIAASDSFDKDSIRDDNIIDQFTSLLNQDSISLATPSFSNPDDNSLQVTAVATLFSKSIKITAVFVIDEEDNLSMTMNSYEDLSMLLSEIYEAGLVPDGGDEEYVPPVPVGGLSFIFDSAATTFILKGEGDNWSFLGYTNLYVKKPALILTSTYNDGLVGYQWAVAGTLTSDSAKVNIPIQVQLPIGITGWSITAGPVTLDNGLGIIDALTGISVSAILPQGFSDLLANIEITSFYAAFDPKEKYISAIQLQVETKADWVIVQDKLKFNKGIRLLLNAQRLGDENPLTFSGAISGSASVNYKNPDEEVQASARIPVPLIGADWEITLANDETPLGFGKLAALVPGVKSFMPDGLYEKLNEIVLEFLTIKFKFDSGFSFTKIAFAIHSAKEWQLPLLQKAVYLDKKFRFELDVPLPYNAATTTGELSGIIQIDDGNVSIPVQLAKTPSDTNWNLWVTSEGIPLPSISDLSSFMGVSVLNTASPSGLMSIGDFSIYDLELMWQFGTPSKMLRFAFTISSTGDSPAWNLVPGYFELTDLFVSIAIDNQSVADKDISGSIGAIVTWILDKDKKSNLVLFMLAEKPSSKDPWKFSGSLQEDLILKDLLLALKTPQPVVNALPDLHVTQFDLSIEPTSGSFSIAMAIKAEDTWTILTIGSLDINMNEMAFSVEKYAAYLEMNASGSFDLVTKDKTSKVTLKAGYKNKDWNFNGVYDNSIDGITINDLLEEYISGIDSSTIPQLQITKVLVDIVKATDDDNKTYNTFNFEVAGQIDILDKILIKADINVLYDSRKEEKKRYDGTKLKGQVEFGGLTFTAIMTYADSKFGNKEFLLTFKHITAKATFLETADSTTFRFGLQSSDPNKTLTLGDLIAYFIEAATGNPVTIPSPWNFILNINLNNFGLLYELDKKTNKKTVGLTWSPNINLGFIEINELSLMYSPGSTDKNGPVEFKVTKGKFLGKDIETLTDKDPKPGWDVRDPSKAPAVPGFGDSKFKLEFLGLGNQVAIKQKTPPDTVNQAITNLAEAFNIDNADKLPPELYFDKNYGVLVGVKFIVVKYIQVAAVFYDPVMYGLSISVKDGKFKNLAFEILYKKVNDNIGMFQINLALPDFVRQQQFGAVSVTLPSIALSIYTNGDFIINMGFPKNGDFSQSFGLEFTIFTGAGGFYFGKLSNDTATMMPKGDGQFNPVIIFGIGIRAGVGRTFNKGPLKAEVSLTLQVILEGILAWYKANPQSATGVTDVMVIGNDIEASDEILYFKLNAQAVLVGRIYGEIDFVIISASLDIVVKVMAQLILESYRQSLITFSAEVYASIQVRINLGLFKITINCSFRTGYSDTFTIGSNQKAPWDKVLLANRSAYFTPLDATPLNIVPPMVWSAPLDYPAEKVNLLFIPQLSVAYDADAPKKKQAVAASLFFVKNIPDSATKTDFTVLCRGFLAWVFNAYFAGKNFKEEKILDQDVNIDDVKAIFNYFDQKEIRNGEKEAFQVSDLYDYFFKQAFTSIEITTRQASLEQSDDPDEEVAFFPIVPLLSMVVNTNTPINFWEYNKCDIDYIKRIRDYFAQMQIQYKETQQAKLLRDAESLTMAGILFIDYFVMMAKTGFQDIINGFKQTAIESNGHDSLENIAKQYKHYGVTPQSLAFANRHKLLKESVSLHVPAFEYQLRDNERLETFLQQLPLQENILAGANGVVTVPSFLYTIPKEDNSHTLWTVANRFGVDFDEFVSYNTDKPGLFAAGTRLLHAFVETKKVGEILDELQNDAAHQMANIAGTVSRFFLHGLRVPRAVTGDDRIALYEATGQQFKLAGTIAGQKVSLGVPGVAPDWLKLGTGAGLQFDFNEDMSTAVNELINSSYIPGVTLNNQQDVIRYKLQPRTFAMSTSFTWKDPNPHSLKTTLADTFIWTFPQQLQQYLTNYNNKIAYQLSVQSAVTPFSQTDAMPVQPMFWGTFVTVGVRRVPVASMPGNYADNVYVVDGCGEADGQLLQQLLLGNKPSIQSLDILFADNSARENKGEEVKGLVSIGLSQYSTFLLQTNYSTISNPDALGDDAPVAVAAPNLLGMDELTFLTYLWECSIVRSGGYYLYYRNSTGGGLPDYLFNEEGAGSIRILVSYFIPQQEDSHGYVLPAYINTAVLDQKIDDQHDTLLTGIALTDAEKEKFNPVLQVMQATILPGTGMFSGIRTNPQSMLAADIGQSADQQLSELFQLMEYRILATPKVFTQSNFALPAGPLDANEDVQLCLSRLPVPMQTAVWNYGSVLPVYPFVDTGGGGLQTDPYAANGKAATVYFNFLDVFGNTLVEEGNSGITQQITPGYTDPVIGIDQWINVTRTYKIALDQVNSQPELSIGLVFDLLRYEQAQDPKALAAQDLKLYQQIANQLVQAGVTASVQCSIGTIKPPATGPLQILQNYITEIINFLSQEANPVNQDDKSIVATLSYGIDTAKLNAEFIFQLSVAITITRTLYIDPQFAQEASIKSSTTDIPPDLYTGTTANKTALSIFAANLEQALPVMKVAVGASGNKTGTVANLNATATDEKEIWVVRFATGGEAGIDFTVAPKPACFGVKPLSTTLISRPDERQKRPVPIRGYSPGNYIGSEIPEQKSFAGIDMELMAQTFISTMDTFLSAQNSTQAWRIEQSGNCLYFEKPFESIEQAKRTVAKAVANSQLTNILQQGDFTKLPVAQAAMEQQMLVLLGNMYKTNAVVQAAVNVSQGFNQPIANLYGQVVFAKNDIPANTYYFTPVKVSLTKGEQTINTFFSVKQEAGSGGEAGIDLIDEFKAGLNFQITGLEHNFGAPINGYIPSSWLTFANPILKTGAASAPLIDADIPIPLKAYPTAPSLVDQFGKASLPSNIIGKSAKEKLEEALLWDYAFKYNYVIARQDLIYLDIELNVVQPNPRIRNDEEPLDLFEALMQFHACQESVMADITKDDPNSLVALQSFGWLVQQVANAWASWFIVKGAGLEKKSLRYIIKEEAAKGTGDLLISVQPEKAGLVPQVLPFITIDGFVTKEYEIVDDKQVFCFVQKTDTSETPLLFVDRKKFSERGVEIKHNNVLVDENAWAGVAIHRNEILAGQLANDAFRYITPYIRFADACYPSITNQDEIDIADFTEGVDPEHKQQLDTLLLNFFNELLKADMEREVMLQIQAGYFYTLQPNPAKDLALGPVLPIIMVPPISITGNTSSKIIELLSVAFLKWFNDHDVMGRDTTGSIQLMLSLFAATGGDMHHPVLILEGLYLPTNVVYFPPTGNP
jgi:hypothetical protein